MKLFNDYTDATKNQLPFDGCVNYYGQILNNEMSNHYFNHLISNVEWENDKAVIFGKTIITKRKVAWYGDKEFDYTYSNTTKKALPWTKELIELKSIIEEIANEKFNSCLLNLYHSGEEGMAWHSDGEKDLKKNGAIGSLSFGAERKFAFRHKKTKETVSMVLEHGSLLVMKDTTQSHWLHRLPPTKRIFQPRVNLTFRTIVNSLTDLE
jgi:alkylated DNA repair dioxygenase AlkB